MLWDEHYSNGASCRSSAPRQHHAVSVATYPCNHARRTSPIYIFFFLNDRPPPETTPLPQPDALPICRNQKPNRSPHPNQTPHPSPPARATRKSHPNRTSYSRVAMIACHAAGVGATTSTGSFVIG